MGLALISPVAGCGHMNQTQTGAAIGGALGTAAGLGIGAATGNPRTGALVGGLAGAGIGGLIGNEADREERREQAMQQAAAVTTAPQRLGLTDIVHLTQQGHDEQVIINQIRATGSTFQLSTADLDWLKANGVSPRVIAEMQTRQPLPVSAAPRAATTSTTIIYETPLWPPLYPYPVVVRPVYVPPPRPPFVFVGGFYRCR